MSFLPKFPLTGNILSNNVALDRFSLVENKVGSNEYPAGQYVFYTKNKSLWYRYKTQTANWTAETLYMSSASQSNTKFDKNGNPVTAWIDSHGAIKLSRVVNGDLSTITLASSGSLPTVVETTDDLLVFWVPPYFTNYLYYGQLCNNFSVVNQYDVTLPGQVSSLQIQTLPDERLLFAFEVDAKDGRKVYIAFSNPAYQFITSDLTAFVEFIYAHMLSDYFVVAEETSASISTESSISGTVPADILAIGDAASFGNYVLVQNNVTSSPEYFIVSAVESSQNVLEVILAYKAATDLFDVSDLAPNAQLTLLVSHTSAHDDYLVVAPVSFSSTLTDAGISGPPANEYFKIDDSIAATTDLTFIGQQFVGAGENQNVTDILLISDDVEANSAPIFTIQQYHAPKPSVQDEMTNYFIIADMESSSLGGTSWNSTQTVFILDEILPTEHLCFGVDTAQYTATAIPTPIDSKFNEAFTITDGASAVFNVGLVIFLHEYHNFYIDDTFTPSSSATVVIDSAKEKESLQLQDALSILLSGYADISQLFLENDVYVALHSVSSSTQNAGKQESRANEGFSVTGGTITVSIANPSITLKALANTGSFEYRGVSYQLSLLAKMLTFGGSGTVKVLYFGSGKQLTSPRPSPYSYNLGVVDGAVVYQLHQL